jgi:serine/threonine protein phosphatase 1
VSTFCIADLHGCYEEFVELLELIEFDPEQDVLYILGDAVDRGPQPLDCLNYLRQTQNVHFLLGNHEEMMKDYYHSNFFEQRIHIWWRNGCQTTIKQMENLSKSEQHELLKYLDKCKYYETVTVNEKPYFLSHSGLDAAKPIDQQEPDDLVWSREEFYAKPGLDGYYCLFGHTPTIALHNYTSCAVWYDFANSDKACIDCGCVYGGALAAMRLDDGKVYYVKSKDPSRSFAGLGWE